MSMSRDQESIHALEGLKSAGQFEAAARAIQERSPLLREMEISEAQAQRVLDALQASPNQLEATGVRPIELEAIIRKTNRPPLIVRNGRVETAGLPPEFGPDAIDKIGLTEKYLAGVGRVEFLNHPEAWGGTGWIVEGEEDPDHLLIITNRHVAEIVARRNSRGEGVFMRSPVTMVRYGAELDFNEEVGASPLDARRAEILKFTYLADSAGADVAIGRIRKPEGFRVAALRLAETAGKDLERVAVIGYPAEDSRNDATDMARYFKGLFDVKRFAPGFLKVGPGLTLLRHDCTTLGGNSGSPVMSLESGKVVGLHFAGRYGRHNSAVRASTLADLLRGERPSQILVEGLVDDTERRDGDHRPEHFQGREGYDPGFLDGFEVPLPTLPDGFDLARPSDSTEDRPHELRYTNFGVLYELTRKSPAVAAVNIDGSAEVKIKRGRDKWFFDLRIPKESQLGQDDFPGDLDRGHMVRREDPNWSDFADPELSARELYARRREIASQANFDTFHYTNASPQHASLNRNRSTWQGLENHILNNTNTRGFRATVMTGPILDEEDPEFEEIGVQLPLEYWKVVVMVANTDDGPDRLHATAYVLSQGRFIAKYLAKREQPEAVEGFAFGAYKTFQVPIADLEKQTGYDFGTLRDADPLNTRRGANEALAGAALILELETPEMAVL